jgi:ABC-2 type transport system permease protein
MTVGSGCATTALNLCMDTSEGIIARFRTMATARAAVLTGQVVGSLIRTMISVVLVVAWCLVLTAIGYAWSRAVYDRNALAHNLSAVR